MDCFRDFLCCRRCYDVPNYEVMRESLPLMENDFPAQTTDFRIDVGDGHTLADVGLTNEAYPYYHPTRGWLLVQPVQKNEPESHRLTEERSQVPGTGKVYSLTIGVGDNVSTVPVKITITIPNDVHDNIVKVMPA